MTKSSSSPVSVKVKVIDFNVAVKLDDEAQILGGTGLKEWSAPETRLKLHTDYKIDCWTLGCIMIFLCTGNQPFKREDKIKMTPEFGLIDKMSDYREKNSFSDMVDFIGKLLINDPEKRLSAVEALAHPFLR